MVKKTKRARNHKRWQKVGHLQNYAHVLEGQKQQPLHPWWRSSPDSRLELHLIRLGTWVHFQFTMYIFHAFGNIIEDTWIKLIHSFKIVLLKKKLTQDWPFLFINPPLTLQVYSEVYETDKLKRKLSSPPSFYWCLIKMAINYRCLNIFWNLKLSNIIYAYCEIRE